MKTTLRQLTPVLTTISCASGTDERHRAAARTPSVRMPADRSSARAGDEGLRGVPRTVRAGLGVTIRDRSDDGDAFYIALGCCISAWSEVEKEMFDLCQRAMHVDKDVASVVYYRTPTIRARLELLNELVKLRLPKTKSGTKPHRVLKMWSAIFSDTQKELETRNRLAHHPVSSQKIVIMNALAEDGTQSRREFSLSQTTVSEDEALRGRHQDQLPLYQADLEAHYFLCGGLSASINTFHYSEFVHYISGDPISK